MRDSSKRNTIGTIVVLAVFTVLAAAVVLLIVSGASVYKRLSEKNNLAYTKRIVSRYLATKIESANSLDEIAVVPFEGTTALCIKEEIAGVDYLTLIYSNGGYIRELFVPSDSLAEASSGERITECRKIAFTADGSAIRANAVLRGGESLVLFYNVG